MILNSCTGGRAGLNGRSVVIVLDGQTGSHRCGLGRHAACGGVPGTGAPAAATLWPSSSWRRHFPVRFRRFHRTLQPGTDGRWARDCRRPSPQGGRPSDWMQPRPSRRAEPSVRSMAHGALASAVSRRLRRLSPVTCRVKAAPIRRQRPVRGAPRGRDTIDSRRTGRPAVSTAAPNRRDGDAHAAC